MRSKEADRNRNLLLISSSKVHGGGYLGHCGEAIKRFLDGVETVFFVPYALKNHDEYAEIARARFKELGFQNFISVHDSFRMGAELEEKVRYTYGHNSSAFFVGGGNTFRLLKMAEKCGFPHVIKRLAGEGMRYIGSSAGTNLACPEISTTNDMPIVWPANPFALNLVGFQINPHYVDPDPNSTHMGETREQRIKEYHEESDVPVLGLRERSWLEIHGPDINLCGNGGAKLFERGKDPLSLLGSSLIYINESL